MVELRLIRPPLPIVIAGLYTDGELFLDGALVANTREDPDRGLDAAMSLSELRARKVLDFTAIPTGRYEVRLYHSGRFGRDSLAVVDVPVFFNVTIHDVDPRGRLGGHILVDPAELAQLKQILVSRLRAGEEAWLTVERAAT